MKKGLFFFISLFFVLGGYAQGNLQQIQVDRMTDAQIEQYVKRAELMGYAEPQIRIFAQAQGVPQAEIQKLQERLKKIKANKSQSDNSNSSISGRKVSGKQSSYQKVEVLERDSTMAARDTVEINSKIFGSTLFRNNNITFEPNLRIATPKSYIIGPDDEILIDITGNNEASYALVVSPEGTINVEYVGIISVSGLSIDDAREKITKRLAAVYPAIRTGQTNVSVTIGDIRSIQVTLTGAVTRPGTYTLPSLASVFNALYASGGPSDNGTFRNIQVIRNNRVVSTVDLYDFLVNGMQTGNVKLQDQDVIHIPVYGNRIEFEGEVKRPAIFEGKNQETLKDVLNYAGGFTDNGYSAKLKVFQKTDKERRISDVYTDQFNDYVVKNGDVFVAEELLDRFENRISVLGAVFRSGAYGLEPGMTLRDALEMAQGIREDAYLDRGIINRLRPDNSLEIINFNIREILSGNAPDIPLKREDKIEIASIFDLRDEYKYTVQGQVRFPGDFPFASNSTVLDLIQKAGGLTEEAKNARIEIARRVQNRSQNDSLSSETIMIEINDGVLSKPDVTLSPYDVITVLGDARYRTQRQVKIEGEVLYPGIYTINREDERLSDLVKRAGGLTSYAYAEGASLRRTGSSKINEVEKKIREQQLKVIADENTKSTFEVDEVNSASSNKQKESVLSKSVEVGAGPVSLEISDLVGIELHKVLAKPKGVGDLFLMDGDIVNVPKELQTVRVIGEVLNPNTIVFQKGKSLKHYVNQAGGYTSEALKKKVFIQYANGAVKGSSEGSIVVTPGAEIIVPKRAPREKMNAQGWVGLGTGVASLAAIIVSLLRK